MDTKWFFGFASNNYTFYDLGIRSYLKNSLNYMSQRFPYKQWFRYRTHPVLFYIDTNINN